MAELITDQNAQLVSGNRYLLYFDLPGGIPTDILRRLSDTANWSSTYLNYAGKAADVELLGTTIAENVDGIAGKRQLLAHVKVHGTPLLAAVGPIVAVCLIVATVFLVIEFKHAIDVTLTSVATATSSAITNIGEGTQNLEESLGAGVQSLTTSAGAGIKYALPILGVGLAVFAVILFTGYAGVKIRS